MDRLFIQRYAGQEGQKARVEIDTSPVSSPSLRGDR